MGRRHRDIPPENEPRISMKKALSAVLKNAVTPNTIYSWARDGVLVGNPRRLRVRLESEVLGGRVRTTAAAVKRFIARTNGLVEVNGQ